MGHPEFRHGAALLVVLAFGLSTGGEAQIPVRLGVQAGLNSANLGGSDAGETDVMTGWSLGAVSTLGAGRISLVPGVILSRKGATQPGQGFSSTLRLTYLQLPALVRIGLSEGAEPGAIGTYVFLGPAIGLKIGCSVSATAGFNSASSSCDEAAGDDPDVARFSSSEFSGIAGIGAQVGAVGLSLQYELGLGSAADNLDLKTRTISAVVRYFWGGPRPDRTMSPRFP